GLCHEYSERVGRGIEMPLQSEGSTSARANTALRIDNHYRPAVWVKDASRAVGVAQSLVSPELRDAFVAANAADYAQVRERHGNRDGGKRLVSLDHARRQRFHGGWEEYRPPAPVRPGLHVFDDYPQAELVGLIDWTPFFQAWELHGRYPAILDDALV